MFFQFLGSLALFIYGMQQMGEGLQKTAGKKLKKILALLTTNPLMGVVVGALVTAIVQSSSATSVMVVGFVNAGLMTLAQSVGVIMGANIGTTVTAQMVAFRLGDYALHAVAIGVITHMFSKRKKVQYIGQVLLGFGILFLGMNGMSDTMRPLRDSVVFFELMEQFAAYPILGVAIGAGVTVIVQSSTAAMGILLGLFAVGAISFQAGIPIILGSNIGTTITAMLSAIGANISAKRAAAAHFIFNILGTGVIVVLLYIIPNFAAAIEESMIGFSNLFGMTPSPERLVANTHTIFNIINTLIWLPFVGLIVTLVNRLIPGDDVSLKRGLSYLDDRMLETPSLAAEQLKHEVARMLEISTDMVEDVRQAFLDNDLELVKSIQKKEEILNELEEELLVFLTKIPQASLSEEDIRTIDMYFLIIDAIESIGDDADELSKLLVEHIDNKCTFSDTAQKSLQNIFDITLGSLAKTYELIENENLDLAESLIQTEEYIDDLQIEYRESHMKRLGEGSCFPSAAIIYLEALENIEHISDQTADIAHSFRERDIV